MKEDHTQPSQGELHGVMNSVCGVVGSLVATEVIKVLTGIPPINYLLLYDANAV